MSNVISEPYPIKFKKEFSYNKQVPTFISNNVGGSDEIARWVLDLNDILYKDEPHAPILSASVIKKITGENGPNNNPVLIKTGALIYTSDSIVKYFDQRSLPSKRLVPDDPQKKKEVMVLYELFTGDYDYELSRYVYSLMI